MLFPQPIPPKTPPRIVVTGAGIVTALGVGWAVNSKAFRTGSCGSRPVTLFDVSRQRIKVAAESQLPSQLPPTRLNKRQIARMDRAGRLLLVAACQAWEQSGWEPSENLPLVLGTTAGGMSSGEAFFRQAMEHPHDRRGQPTRAFTYHAHAQSRLLADALGFAGTVINIANACASGSSAIGQAWELLRMGQAERVLTGGYDALTQLVFSGFDSLQALSKTTCRPFDAHRDGLLLGDGAAVLALETLENARRRNADILGEVVGYGASVDTNHLTQPQPDGDAAFLSMSRACESAQVSPDQIGYVNAHGTGTPLNDAAEAMAINRWANSHARNLPVSSTKASVGHLLGGAGAVEAVVCLMILREQWLPPEPSVEEVDPLCAFPIVRTPMDANANLVLSNSFGFGGVNATLIFRRWA
jgi:3-oxoacyl-[acyl-carrier-protein] synthase II